MARVLFPGDERGSPPPDLHLGVADLGPPQDETDFPLFPVAVQRDLPFVLVGGYRAGGELDWAAYLDWCGRRGAMLERPLQPPADPLAAAEELIASEAWRRLEADEAHETMLREQALRAAAGPASHWLG